MDVGSPYGLSTPFFDSALFANDFSRVFSLEIICEGNPHAASAVPVTAYSDANIEDGGNSAQKANIASLPDDVARKEPPINMKLSKCQKQKKHGEERARAAREVEKAKFANAVRNGTIITEHFVEPWKYEIRDEVTTKIQQEEELHRREVEEQ